MATVWMLAKNSVVRDARILKEADSLASAGHNVTILCLMDAHCLEPETHRASGVRILRSNHRGLLPKSRTAWRIVARWLFARGVSGTASDGSSKASRIGTLKSWCSARVDAALLALRAKALKKIYTSFFADVADAIRPDVVHCHDIEPLSAAVAAKHKFGCKLIFDAHEIYEDMAQGSAAIKGQARAILKRHDRDIDGFITINDSIAEFYAHCYSLPQPTVLKNASRQAPEFEYDGRLHEAAGLPRSQRILLYQGGFAEKRGLRTLVQAASMLDLDWTLVMMGWGKLEPALRELADVSNRSAGDRRIHPSVVFVPPAPQDDLALWSAGADVGTIPYENIGLNHLYCTPNKLWEYPNAGVPILCSPLVEMTKVIKDHGVGWLLPDDDTPSAVAGVVNALTHADIDRARTACRRYLEADNWAKYEVRLLDLYQDMGLSIGKQVAAGLV